jgi:RNA polymerase sigma-70 factor (ECF subfamily)
MAVFEVARSARREPLPLNPDLPALQRREPDAWQRLFEAHHPIVFRAVLSQLGEPEAAEDITAQVFLEAVEGIDRFRERGRPIRAWLLAIARYRVSDWRRKQQRVPVAAADLAALVSPSPEETALTALLYLTPEQREVVHLRFIEGYRIEEVAVLTGRSGGAVKSLQHRGLARLRAVMGSEWHGR